jgi:hypothetical protein
MPRRSKEQQSKSHYVDNKEFFKAMVEYLEQVKTADTKGVDRPRIPDYIGDCFMKIATHLSYKPNFINYTYRDDMIMDGVENCIQYIYNFDPEKTQNPFAYFTQIIWYAFLRRIQKEKRQLYIKYKQIEQMDIEDAMSEDSISRKTNIREEHAARLEFIKNYEEAIEESKKKQRQVKFKKDRTSNGSTLFGDDDE